MRPALRAVLAWSLIFAPPGVPAGAQGNDAPAPPGTLRIALVNMKCRFTDGPDAEANRRNLRLNLDRHLYFIDRVSKEGVDLIGCPELSLNGDRFSKGMTWLRRDGPQIGELAAAFYTPEFDPPAGDDTPARWASGARGIGPDGKGLAEMPPSPNRTDAKEFILRYDLPIGGRK
jgi:hypothetical protein